MNRDAAKRAAARAAVALVEDGMRLGLGSGSTALMFIDALAERARRGELPRLVCVATSEAAAAEAVSRGLKVVDLADELDLAIDGADEVFRPDFRLIKGLGGALVREKIVAEAARRFVVIIDSSKLVERLGIRAPLPVELVPFGAERTRRRIEALGLVVNFRLRADGTPKLSDNGNPIADCVIGPRHDVATLSAKIGLMAGVVATGYFAGLVERVLVGHDDGSAMMLMAAAKRGCVHDAN